MPRVLGTHKNELKIHDNLSHSDITLYYRMPVTEEAVGYTNETLQRKGKKVKTALGETRQKYGLKILTGFEEGGLAKPSGDGQVLFSSDPRSECFDPEWKTLIAEHAPDLIEVLAIHVFEQSIDQVEDDEDEIEKN